MAFQDQWVPVWVMKKDLRADGYSTTLLAPFSTGRQRYAVRFHTATGWTKSYIGMGMTSRAGRSYIVVERSPTGLQKIASESFGLGDVY